MKPSLLLAAFLCFNCFTALSQTNGDYRSAKSGEWKAASTWQRFDGINWVTANTFPIHTDGNISLRTGDTIVVKDTVMVDQVNIQTGAVLHLLPSSGSARFILHNGAGTDMVSNGRIIVAPLAAIDDDTTVRGSVINYTNDSLINNGGITAQVIFNSANNQKVPGNGYMGPVVVNNASNIEITGITSVQSVRFDAGRISVTGTGVLVITQYGSGFTGQNENRFVDGKVDCIIYDNTPVTFSIPLGKADKYLPVVFNAQQTSSVETHFIFTITDGAPPARTLPASLTRVSSIRYYTISKSVSASTITNASIQLSYTADDNVSDVANLRIAKSNDGSWVNIGGMGTGLPGGTISSTVNFTTFSDFVLANATGGNNTLPLSITSFTATNYGKLIMLNWKVENEAGIDFYEVERKDGNSWRNINTVKSNGKIEYSFVDNSSEPEHVYEYRLKQVNKDGQSFYSRIVTVKTRGLSGKMQIVKMYPVPVENSLYFFVENEKNDVLNVAIQNMQGISQLEKKIKPNALCSLNVSTLSKGSYIMVISNEKTGEKVVKNFIRK